MSTRITLPKLKGVTLEKYNANALSQMVTSAAQAANKAKNGAELKTNLTKVADHFMAPIEGNNWRESVTKDVVMGLATLAFASEAAVEKFEGVSSALRDLAGGTVNLTALQATNRAIRSMF
jgi:uncharacterized phage infection (PIP) family protein YhgE